MTKRKRWSPSPPLRYRVDLKNKRILILRNGTRIKQSIPGVGLYTSRSGAIYALTKKGLSQKTISYNKKKNYGKKTRGGTTQGQRYPYIMFQGHKYEVHVLVTLAWRRKRRKGEEIDHVNGNIEDCRVENLRIITSEMNHWCSRVLRRLRKIAKLRDDPALNPINIPQKDLLTMFKRLKGKDLDIYVPQEIERYRTLVTLRRAAAQLHDPSLNPDNMPPKRRNLVLSKYFIDDETRVIRRNIIRKR